jgi:hypothetical protein
VSDHRVLEIARSGSTAGIDKNRDRHAATICNRVDIGRDDGG